MITVEEATQHILSNLFTPRLLEMKTSEAVGRVLAEPVVADRDFPPFNRVSMDGIAIRHEEWSRGRRSFKIQATQAAGEPARSLRAASDCLEVMTGAVLPYGCDTVIRYEDVNIAAGEATVKAELVEQGQSVHPKGIDGKKGEVILERGQVLAPSEIALLASVGKSAVATLQPPATAVISTGDELVDISDVPREWQIRRSNSYAIQAALLKLGGEAECFHLKDDRLALQKGLEAIARDYDVLILSGGVSKGKFDYVPQVLEDIGIIRIFHQVSQRPGKPFWFGASRSGKIAFALPGNPVSTFMCFYRYIRPWVQKSLGIKPADSSAVLTTDFTFASPLTYFLQVSVSNRNGIVSASPVPGGGSGDFANLRNVDGFLELPPGRGDFKGGEVFPFIAFRQ